MHIIASNIALVCSVITALNYCLCGIFVRVGECCAHMYVTQGCAAYTILVVIFLSQQYCVRDVLLCILDK